MVFNLLTSTSIQTMYNVPTAGLYQEAAGQQNGSNASCHQFTLEQWHILIIARTVSASLSCLACCIAFIRKFAHHLLLYLNAAAFCLSIFYALQILPTIGRPVVLATTDIHLGTIHLRKAWPCRCMVLDQTHD